MLIRIVLVVLLLSPFVVLVGHAEIAAWRQRRRLARHRWARGGFLDSAPPKRRWDP